MNKRGFLKDNSTVIFNIIYLAIAVYIIVNKIIDYMFNSTSLTFGYMYIKSEGIQRLFYIAVNEYDFIVWICVLYFVFLLSNIIIHHKDDTDYKLILPINLCLMIINTVISLYYSINNYIFIKSTDRIYIQNELVMASYGNVKICLVKIILISVCFNIVLLLLIKRKKKLNSKTTMIGVTISSFPMLIVPIVMLLPILQMWNMVA